MGQEANHSNPAKLTIEETYELADAITMKMTGKASKKKSAI